MDLFITNFIIEIVDQQIKIKTIIILGCICFLFCCCKSNNINSYQTTINISNNVSNDSLFTITNITEYQMVYLIDVVRFDSLYRVVSAITPLSKVFCKKKIEINKKYKLILNPINKRDTNTLPSSVELMYNNTHIPVKSGEIVYVSDNLVGVCILEY